MSAPPNTSPISTPLVTITPQRVVSQPSSHGKTSDKKPVVVNASHRSRGSPNNNRTSDRNRAEKLKKMVKKYNELDASSAFLHAIYTEMHNIDVNIAELEAKALRLYSSTEQLKTQVQDMYDIK